MITSMQELAAVSAIMDEDCANAAAKILAHAKAHVIHLELHTEGRCWYERRGADLRHTALGERVSDVEALLATKAANPGATVTVQRGAMGGINATIF